MATYIRIAKYAIILAVGALLSSCQESKEAPPQKERPPNIVLIIADDQGWGDLSFHGNTNLNTSHIDALAKNGVSFTNFYVQPVCSPTRAELLTGRYASRLGVYDTSAGGERLNLGETTIAEIFKNAGYQTAAYGKWHSGMQPPYHPNARGFDDFYGFTSGHWGNYFDPLLEHNGQLVKGEGFLVDDITNKGLEFIVKNKDHPFFLYLPFNTPHSPMQVPDVYWDRFKTRELGMRYKDSLQEKVNFTRAALAMVENIDDNVGRVSNKLKELGLEENTIILYLSDNGPNGWRWNGGMRGRKGATDEGGVRSPLFIQWKNVIPANTTVSTIGGVIDLLPTLSKLAGIEPLTKKPLDGLDLAAAILGKNEGEIDRILFNHWNGKTSVRSSAFRLDHENRLYHIPEDRGQKHDVSSEHPEMVDSLKTAKETWLANMPELSTEKDNRPYTLGHPDYPYTQIPARDGIAYGTIVRSNRWPNCSFFTNWTQTTDRISWDIEVLASGTYDVSLYYTCKEENVGTLLSLEHGNSKITTRITEPHDPPLRGMEHDRDPRIESYVKDFKPLSIGPIALEKGRANMVLKALEIPGKEAIDFRLLLFKRIE